MAGIDGGIKVLNDFREFCEFNKAEINQQP